MNVSVVIPAWNAEETLAETLDSLLAQTHRAWEAVVVDDGSTDETARIALAYGDRDPRIRLLQRNRGGEAAARNSGLAEVRHDWLLFLDSDDWIASEYLERLTCALSTDRTLDAVHCGYARVTADGARLVDPYEPPTGDMFAVWARRSAFPVHACVVRTVLVREVGGFDPSLRKSPDWDLWQRVARTGANFGAVRETLAFYRMRPSSASLEAAQMLRDGLTVIRRGHAPDARVPRPHPDHARGSPPEEVRTQAWYLVSWCAGLMLGRGEDARPLIALCDAEPFPELYPPAVAQAIWDAAPLPSCESSRIWAGLWLRIQPRVDEFLTALETATGCPDLASLARAALVRRVLRGSPALCSVAEELEAAEASRNDMQGHIDWRDDRIGTLETALAEAERHVAEIAAQAQALRTETQDLQTQTQDLQTRTQDLQTQTQALEAQARAFEAQARAFESRASAFEAQARALEETRDRMIAERKALEASLEHRAGHFLVNRLPLRRLITAVTSLVTTAGQKLATPRLVLDRALRPNRRRIMTTACWNFPIHSQTFVYQELTHLIRHGFDVRLVYSKIEPRDQLPGRYAHLWRLRRRLFLNRRVHEHDYDHYRRRMEERVDTLLSRLCEASGLSRQALVNHGNFLEAFSFTRMVEAYRPDYLHSYFFYDRSLMALVAAYLLEIPRGVTCYADHVLDDYELKVVPLHMEMCDVVIATSERIRRELMAIAPHVDPTKILVKPNGIDPDRFPSSERSEPEVGAPFRLVSVCRIEPKKGLLDLVDAVHFLRERGVDVEAHIVGTPDEWSPASVEYARRLDARISEHNLWGKVHLEGRQDLEGVLRFHRMAHVFVAPFVEIETGDKDGIPTALLEGMSSGLPAVATDAGSITEVVEEGKDGLIVPQRRPDALADAIQDLLANPTKRADFGRNAAAAVRVRCDASTLERGFHEKVDALLAC